MPARSFKPNKRLVTPAIRVYSGSRFGGKDQKVKVMTAAKICEEKRQLDARRRKKEEHRKYFLITREHIIDLFSTGLTALMRQKITEAGMTANQEPDTIDWEVVPDASHPDDPMDVDSHLDDWEDVFEEDLGAEGQTVGQGETQNARLRAIITCVLSFFPPAIMYL